MQQAQILAYGLQGRLVELLQELADRHGVSVREVSQAKACKNLLRTSGAAVLVLRTGRNLEEEMTLLEETARLFPDVATVVVSDIDHPLLAGLAWDLGARFVLLPPQPLQRLTEIVLKLLSKP